MMKRSILLGPKSHDMQLVQSKDHWDLTKITGDSKPCLFQFL